VDHEFLDGKCDAGSRWNGFLKMGGCYTSISPLFYERGSGGVSYQLPLLARNVFRIGNFKRIESIFFGKARPRRESWADSDNPEKRAHDTAHLPEVGLKRKNNKPETSYA
jgi:hypothetical protein